MIYMESGAQRVGKATMYVVGPLRLIGSDGADRTPRGRKACALLALLALAPENKRARHWIQDKLWSDRGSRQGSDSLRQTLAEIRRALGADRDCFTADRFMIALDSNHIHVETKPQRPVSGGDIPLDECILLEGLDVRDPEFEDWLRDQRSRFETEMQTAGPADVTTPNAAQPASFVETTQPGRMQLVLESAHEAQSRQDSVIADTLTDLIAKTIAELGTIDVLDHREGFPGQAIAPQANVTLTLQTAVSQGAAGAIWRVLLSEAASRRVIWAVAAHYGNADAFNIDNPSILGQLNQIVDVAIGGFISTFAAQGERSLAISLCRQAIQHLLKLGKENFLIADRLFERAFDLEPRGVYLAWRAYLRTFLLIERQYSCRQTLIEEALGFVYRALEMEPLNSYVASFGAHAHAIMRRSHVAAYELAQRSIQLNRANPLAWASLGMAECYLGKTRAGQEHVLMAREIAGATPFRFQMDGLSCIASSIVGDFERAIWCGEASHALSPSYAPPLRYLSALYLFRGEHERSHETVEKLRALEPDFSYDKLRDKSYPAIGLHSSNLLELLPTRQI